MKLPPRPIDSNKATFGNVLNIAGSLNYRGAAFLSSVSALRTGAGYVSLAAVPPVIDAVAAQLPDAVYIPLPSLGPVLSPASVQVLTPLIKAPTVCAFGCGISAIGHPFDDIMETVFRILELFIEQKVFFVLDADGLNALSLAEKQFRFEGRAVLTPHPKELARLLHTDVSKIQKDRIDAARESSQKFDAVVLLKGFHTVIANGNDYRINDTGNSALSKAGSGDVLTGIIAGLLAQKMEPFDAATLGAKIHGLAGELASAEKTEYGVLASDLPNFIPRAIQGIQ